jgi:6-phosphofructokinase 1
VTGETVRGITHLGGTILGTTNRGNPFAWPVKQPDGTMGEVDRSDEVVAAFRRLGLGAMIVVGGDGSLKIAQRRGWRPPRPKTIDNDARNGHLRLDTAVTATDAMDKLH